jgi:hypothetical protein
VGEALVRLPRAARKEPGYRYEGTNRYHRGRVLAQLREDASASDEEIDLRDLGRRVCEGFTDDDVPWLYGVVESLRKRTRRCGRGACRLRLRRRRERGGTRQATVGE